MKRIFVIVAFLLATFSAVAQTKDVVGWQGTTWGMTLEEVQQAVPAAKRLKDKPENGMVFALSIPKYKVAGHDFSVSFRFNATEPMKLKQVSVAIAGSMSPKEYWETFASLEKLLTEAYGAPALRRDTATPGEIRVQKKYRNWFLKNTKIELSIQALASVVILTVVYEPNGPAATSLVP